MAILWTLIVLGAHLQGMQCNADSSTAASKETTQSNSVDITTAGPTKPTTPLISSSYTNPNIPSASLTFPTVKSTTAVTLDSSTPTPTLNRLEPTTPASPSSSPDSSTPTAPPTAKTTEPHQPETTSSVTDTPTSQNGPVTTQITTTQPKTPNADTTLTVFNKNTQNSPTIVTATDSKQGTTNLNAPATTASIEAGTTQLLSTQTNLSPSIVTEKPKSPITPSPDSQSAASQNPGTKKAQTTASIIPGQDITANTSTHQTFYHSIDLSSSTEKSVVREACKTLGQKMKGNCTVIVKIHDKQLIATVTIDANQTISTENYKPLEPDSRVTKNSTLTEGVNKETIPDTLIAILASCGALVLILCCFAAYCTYHRRSYRKNQQHLTEELQTVENGYHDNPTLEVMEVQPEMQEKKLTMNGEFNDSWIVPIDNLLKEDIPDEEDTHL